MNWMPLREFLRGGYRTLDGPTVVSNHGRPAFTVFPHEDRPVHPPAQIRTSQGRGVPKAAR